MRVHYWLCCQRPRRRNAEAQRPGLVPGLLLLPPSWQSSPPHPSPSAPLRDWKTIRHPAFYFGLCVCVCVCVGRVVKKCIGRHEKVKRIINYLWAHSHLSVLIPSVLDWSGNRSRLRTFRPVEHFPEELGASRRNARARERGRILCRPYFSGKLHV